MFDDRPTRSFQTVIVIPFSFDSIHFQNLLDHPPAVILFHHLRVTIFPFANPNSCEIWVMFFSSSLPFFTCIWQLHRHLTHDGAKGLTPYSYKERGKVCANHSQQRIQFLCNFLHLSSFCPVDRGDITLLLNLILVPSSICF